jgi:hypothetical protein
MDSGMFESAQTAARTKRAETEVRHMGYEFHLSAASIGPPKDGSLPVTVDVENRGVAPFYYDWPIEYALIRNRQVAKTFRGASKITGLLPNKLPSRWDEHLDLKGIEPADYLLAIRIPNPMPKGHPLRFANKSQDADQPGWTTLGAIKLP